MGREKLKAYEANVEALRRQRIERANELERDGRFEEAEKAMCEAIDSLYAWEAIAEMYRTRAQRLGAAGDEAGRRDAVQRARSAIDFLAAQATSGGEGAALSMIRDQFLRTLGE